MSDLLDKYYLELLVNYLKENLNEKEYLVMENILNDKNIIQKIETKELTYFEYDNNEYIYPVNCNILIKPKYDGNFCSFYIDKSILYFIYIELPEGLRFNTKTGEISGCCKTSFKRTNYIIKCKNATNSIKYSFSLFIEDAFFIEDHKSVVMTISNGNKSVSNIINQRDKYPHCYLNIKIDEGVYHIKYRVYSKKKECYVILGASKSNSYENFALHNSKTSCCFGYGNTDSDLWGSNGNKYLNPHINTNCFEDIECVYNMDKKTFSIVIDTDKSFLLFTHITGPIYPFVICKYEGNFVDIVKYWKE